MTSPAHDEIFTTVHRVRFFDEVVTQVRDAILSGAIAPGVKLPSERELCERLGVSRTTVREALRALEALGLVEVRLGSHGGAFAKEPDAAMLGQALSTMLLFQQATMADLNEFRHSFEAENAYLAALRADTDDLEVLESLAAQARATRKDKPGWIELEELDLRVHEAIAVATHNPVRVAIMSGIHDALKRNLAVLQPLTSYSASLRKDILAIVDLITARDAEGAKAHMQRHLDKWQKISASPPRR